MRPGKVRLEGERVLIVRHCLVPFALRRQRIGEIVMGFEMIRLQGKRAPIMHDRFIDTIESA